MKRLMTFLFFVPFITLADSRCQLPGSYFGIEGMRINHHASRWNSNDNNAFRHNNLLNAYGSVSLNCTVGESLRFKSEINGEYLVHQRQPGELQDSKHGGKIFYNQLNLSWTPHSALFIDTGKILRRYGYLYSLSPLDMLRNPHGAFRSVHVNASGDNWPTFYDEGAWGVAATFLTASGSWDAVIMPRLTRGDDNILNWHQSSLERTNGQERYLLSYSMTGLQDTTATFSLLTGEKKRVAAGVNHMLNDSWVITAEAGIGLGQNWNHLQKAASKGLHRYDATATDKPFNRRKHGATGEIGAGIRFTSSNQIESGLEYYGQSEGYSRSEWRQFTKDVAFANGGFVNPDVFFSSFDFVRSAYRTYSRLMAAEIDQTGREGYLQGKHYLTLFSSRNRSETGALNWRTSAIVNLMDLSTMANLQLSSPFKESMELYSGVSVNIGADDSEFGIFGKKELYYAGLRYYW